MSHWLLDAVSQKRSLALESLEANKPDEALLRDMTSVLEIVVVDWRFEESPPKPVEAYAAEAFRMLRVLPLPENSSDAACQLLRMLCFAILGGQKAKALAVLQKTNHPGLPLESSNWGERTWALVLDVWLRLMGENIEDSKGLVLQKIAGLKAQQDELEKTWLDGIANITTRKVAAVELIALYHLIGAAERFVEAATNDTPQSQDALASHFKMAAECERPWAAHMKQITKLLWAAALKTLAR